MLEVQKYLSEKTLEQLTEEYGIRVARHDSLPLVILNYHQIESPKTHPIVRECRGLVLHAETKSVVARSFNRFFNWGECQDDMAMFDWSDFSVQSKEDGSLILLYFHDGKWMCNTRGAFAGSPMGSSGMTFAEGVSKAIDMQALHVYGRRNLTYVCEFVSPWNKVVRSYQSPKLYLLTAFDMESGQELSQAECDAEAVEFKLERPSVHNFRSIEEIVEWLRENSAGDATFEGVVIRDKNGQRWKVKSPTYLSLHGMKGDDGFTAKKILPFILNGETDELLAYFPECAEIVSFMKGSVSKAFSCTQAAWNEFRGEPDRKSFAIRVKDHPFSALLFRWRTASERGEAVDTAATWKESADLILKKLFADPQWEVANGQG